MEATSRYLAAIDEARPGFVEMLFLTGSVALGAYQPGRSDIDLMIVTRRSPGPDDLDAMAAVHAAVPQRPSVDGIYLDRSTFAEQPDDQPVVPFVVDGRFRSDRPCGDLNPVLWLLLSRYGIPVRGPAVAELGLTVDLPAVRRYNLGNLRTYWSPLAVSIRTALDAGDGLDAETITWCVLGPARLHFTLANEDIISKAGAGAYLAALFPEFAPLVERALAFRRREPVGFSPADARATADAIDAVVADAWNRWG